MGKVVIGKTSEIPPEKSLKITVEGKEILVTNVNGNYYAMDDTCTHSGASLADAS